MVISQFQLDGVSSLNIVESIMEAGKVKLNHGYAFDDENEIMSAKNLIKEIN